jgi:hypothetical protein
VVQGSSNEPTFPLEETRKPLLPSVQCSRIEVAADTREGKAVAPFAVVVDDDEETICQLIARVSGIRELSEGNRREGVAAGRMPCL